MKNKFQLDIFINYTNSIFTDDSESNQNDFQQAEITRKICNETIDSIITNSFSRLRRQNSRIAFALKNSYHIISEVLKLFKKEKAVLEISTRAKSGKKMNTKNNENPEENYEEKSDTNFKEKSSKIIVVGDIHGNIDTLVRIFSREGYPSTQKYLFLGDLVDRGTNSCEVLILLYAYKILYPDNVYIIRGNHEFKEMASSYGFKRECIERIPREITQGTIIYNGYHFFNRITDTFQYLPLCAIVNESIFCVHGGITALLESKEQLLSISKVGDDYTADNSVQVEFLWNDPEKGIEYSYERSPRGIGCIFNQEALDSFLKTMDFSMVIRGHQMCSDGFEYPFGENGGILTVFSSNDYCGDCNSAAVAFISDDNDVSIRKFNSLDKETAKVLIAPIEMFDLNKNVLFPIGDNDLKLNHFKNNIPISIEI